jgi:hypothetical protein
MSSFAGTVETPKWTAVCVTVDERRYTALSRPSEQSQIKGINTAFSAHLTGCSMSSTSHKINYVQGYSKPVQFGATLNFTGGVHPAENAFQFIIKRSLCRELSGRKLGTWLVPVGDNCIGFG